KEVRRDRKITRVNPSATDQVIGHVHVGTIEDIDLAVATAKAALPAWSQKPVEERARLLEMLADKMQERKFDLAALQVLEVGKGWREADGDVAEAIDFCRYYARHMRRLGSPQRM